MCRCTIPSSFMRLHQPMSITRWHHLLPLGLVSPWGPLSPTTIATGTTEVSITVAAGSLSGVEAPTGAILTIHHLYTTARPLIVHHPATARRDRVIGRRVSHRRALCHPADRHLTPRNGDRTRVEYARAAPRGPRLRQPMQEDGLRPRPVRLYNLLCQIAPRLQPAASAHGPRLTSAGAAPQRAPLVAGPTQETLLLETDPQAIRPLTNR